MRKKIIKYNLMLALQEKNAGDYESTAPNVNFTDQTVSQSFQIASRQNFVQAGGFFSDSSALSDAKVWLGKRYYNRHDIHINDYFYWNNSGPGAGLEDIDAGPLKLAFAYHQTGGNGNAKGDVVGKRFSTRFYDIGVFNKFAVVFGSKLGSGFEWLPTNQGGGDAKSNSWRIHDQFYFDLAGSNVSGMGVGELRQSQLRWRRQHLCQPGRASAVRLQRQLQPRLRSRLRHRQDRHRHQTQDRQADHCAANRSGQGFWARPVFRAFATYAKWNGDARAQASGGSTSIGPNGVFGDKRNGMNCGLQVETWW